MPAFAGTTLHIRHETTRNTLTERRFCDTIAPGFQFGSGRDFSRFLLAFQCADYINYGCKAPSQLSWVVVRGILEGEEHGIYRSSQYCPETCLHSRERLSSNA
jgi:hypothetical protein